MAQKAGLIEMKRLRITEKEQIPKGARSTSEQRQFASRVLVNASER
jgi:hypothetical protein